MSDDFIPTYVLKYFKNNDNDFIFKNRTKLVKQGFTINNKKDSLLCKTCLVNLGKLDDIQSWECLEHNCDEEMESKDEINQDCTPTYIAEKDPYSSDEDSDDMSRLKNRLETFADWPIPYIIQPEDLAREGFFFLKDGDKVECYVCHGVLNKWRMGDEAYSEHKKHFPHCILVNSDTQLS